MILIQMSDMLWMSASWGKINLGSRDELEVAIELLEAIANGTKYSPHLAEGWLKWRYRVQLYWHGASNQSSMPNDIYNGRRQALAQIIQFHLRTHPHDQIAKEQLEVLTSAPDIRPMAVGNSAVLDWAGDQ